RDARADRRRRPAAARHPRAVVGRVRPDRPGLAPRRRLPPHHPHHRGAADGVGGRDDAGHLLGEARRGHGGDRARRQPPARPAALDRHQAAVPAQAVVERRQAPEPVLPAGAGAPGPVHGVPPPGVLMRKPLVLAAAALAVVAPTAGAAVSVRGLDTSRLPLVRLTVAADSSTPGKPPAFVVTENGSQVGKVAVSAPSDASSIVLAIDTSGSMKGGPIKEALGAAGQFLASVKPNDQVAIVTFGHTAQV